MTASHDDISEKLEQYFLDGNFDKIIAVLSDALLEKAISEDKAKAAELYVRLGNAWYYKNEYDKACVEYDKAIKIDNKCALAFYNRGYARGLKSEDYDKAIEDYDKAIEIDADYASAYVCKASILRFQKKYSEAIENYDKAIEIDPQYASAYYNRGLAKKESKTDLIGSKQDFEKYLELTADGHDSWANYARYYIERINERINDKELSAIVDLIDNIKDVLLVNEDCITHYTTLSVLKSLILDSSKFRISEGNSMNDPSEGMEFFNFLNYTPFTLDKDGFLSEKFSPKPFIGSFVTEDKHDDLNMWRFYGKEEGVEAKGCAITLNAKQFISDITNSLPKEGDYLDYESDINFYWVAYLETGTNKFHTPGSDMGDELNRLMAELKNRVGDYRNSDNAALERHLNSIAFLFKSDAYRNENEVRMVVRGLEFEKKFNLDLVPPRVYIELEPIKKIVKKITLGPKVDKASEWASVFHYNFEISPEIVISHLPYK